MNLTQAMASRAMKPMKAHVADPEKRTLCGQPQTGRKIIGRGQAAILIDGSASRVCRVCRAAMEAGR
jgi:hypothetical protein